MIAEGHRNFRLPAFFYTSLPYAPIRDTGVGAKDSSTPTSVFRGTTEPVTQQTYFLSFLQTGASKWKQRWLVRFISGTPIGRFTHAYVVCCIFGSWLHMFLQQNFSPELYGSAEYIRLRHQFRSKSTHTHTRLLNSGIEQAMHAFSVFRAFCAKALQSSPPFFLQK